MFVPFATPFAERLGYFEVDRSCLLSLGRALQGDDLYAWCSKLVVQWVYSSSGRLSEKKKKKKKKKKRKSSSEEEGGEEERETSPLDRAWNDATLAVLVASHAHGMGLATSRRVWFEALAAIADRERSHGLDVAVLPPALENEDEADIELFYLDARTVRVFFSPLRREWMAATPSVRKVFTTNVCGVQCSTDQVKMELICSETLADTPQETLEWFFLPEVYAYVSGPGDLPDWRTRRPSSKVQRLLPERAREQLNNMTLSRVNLQNSGPPVVLEKKDDGGGKNKYGEGSGEFGGQSNDHARLNPNGSVDQADLDDIGKALVSGAPAITQTPSPYNEFLDRGLRAKTAVKVEESFAEMGLVTDAHSDADILGAEPAVKDRVVMLARGRTVGQTQLPVAPAYFNEQSARRRHAAAAAFDIPMGILLNYSLIAPKTEGQSGLGSGMGNKDSGLGGATSSTKSTAFALFEKAMRAVASSLELWSEEVMAKMSAPRKERARQESEAHAAKHMADAEVGFFATHGSEKKFYEGEPTKGQIQLRAEDKAWHMEKARDAYVPLEKEKEVAFRLPRQQPVEVVQALFVNGWIKAETGVRRLNETLQWDEDEFESPEALEQVRKMRNEPPQEEGGEGGEKKKKKKAKP